MPVAKGTMKVREGMRGASCRPAGSPEAAVRLSPHALPVHVVPGSACLLWS